VAVEESNVTLQASVQAAVLLSLEILIHFKNDPTPTICASDDM
jgi:hypothetical protein